MMSYLYGDSSTSSLQSNFIQFLGDALDFSVHALLSAERMRRHAERIAALKSAADAESARLEALGKTIAAAVSAAEKGDAQSPTAACAGAVLATVAEIVRKHESDVRATLSGDVAAVEAEDAVERQGCLAALEALLRQHDPPSSSISLALLQSGQHYAASRVGETTFGLEWTNELEIAAPHPLAQIARVDKFVPQLEILAPESGGWLRKEIKNRPQRLDKYYISELLVAKDRTLLKLRAHAEGGGPGFDIEIGKEEPCVRPARVGEVGEAPAPFDVSEADAAKLLALHEKVVAAANEAAQARSRLVEAKVDGVAFLDVGDPSELVERLIGAMAPVVREIAQHSLAPTELVLKRLVGDNRREEIFVSKAALNQKLAPLGEAQQAKFKALALSSGDAVRPPPIPAEPEPARPIPTPIGVGPSVSKAMESRNEPEPSVIIAR